MSYYDDQAEKARIASTEAAAGSVPYWNAVRDREYNESLSRTQREAEAVGQYLKGLDQTVNTPNWPPVFSASGTSTVSGYVGANTQGSSTSRRAGWLYLLWLIVWAVGVYYLYLGIEGRFNAGWTHYTLAPNTHVSSDGLRYLKGSPEAWESTQARMLRPVEPLLKDPVKAKSALATCTTNNRCQQHPLGAYGYLASHATDSTAYWNAVCGTNYNNPFYRKMGPLEWAAAPSEQLPGTPACRLTNAEAVRSNLAQAKDQAQLVLMGIGLGGLLLPWGVARMRRRSA